jgi:hypothetical protein
VVHPRNAVAVAVINVNLAFACGAENKAVNAPPVAASTSAASTPAVAGSGAVTEADCEAWATKFVTCLTPEYVASLRACTTAATKPGLEAPMRKAEGEAEDAFAERMRDVAPKIAKECKIQAGRQYLPRDALCYLSAKKPQDWEACNFVTPYFADFGTVGQSLGGQIADDCKDVVDAAMGHPKKSP